MHFDFGTAIEYCWGVFGFVWLVGLAFNKRTVRAETDFQRLAQFTVIALGYVLIGSPWLEFGWLGLRLLPAGQSLEVAGFVLTALGCLFAIWARLTIGSNWSGRATVKENHELITRGPYSLARHPIYTGLILATLGTALESGKVRATVGFGLVAASIAIKIGREEKLMHETFPEAYPSYRARVKTILPWIF
jgi:protein-S-isoprenylcysteine O-methyltransferase Ste14